MSQLEETLNENSKTFVEKKEGDVVKLTVTVAAKEVSRYVAAAYKDAAASVRIPGFRPGRAPRPVVEGAVGGKDAILGLATERLVNDVYPLAVDQEDLIVVKEPELKAPENVVDGQDYTFSVALDIKPLLELSSYEPVEVEVPIEAVTVEDMEQQLQYLREQYYDFEEVDRPSQEKDIVTLAIDATNKDGVPDTAISTSERLYTLENGVLGDAFDAQIMGMSAGETKEFDFDFADETIHAVVTIKKVSVKHLPEVDDDLARRTGCSSLAHLKTIIYDGVAKSKDQAVSDARYNRCISALAERLQGTVPESEVQSFVQDMSKRFFEQLQSQGKTLDTYLDENDLTYDQFQADILLQATDAAREAYALDAVAQHFGFQVNDFDFSRFLVSAGVKDPVALRDQYEKSGQMGLLKESILRNKAADWVVDNAIIKEVGTPYDIEPDRIAARGARFELPLDFALGDLDESESDEPIDVEPVAEAAEAAEEVAETVEAAAEEVAEVVEDAVEAVQDAVEEAAEQAAQAVAQASVVTDEEVEAILDAVKSAAGEIKE